VVTLVNNSRVILLSTLAICALLTAPSEVQAHRLGRGWHYGWPHNQWGYVGLIRGGWGLGGIADAPWVGGSIIGVSSYGPYPYGLYPWHWRTWELRR
jgi:hypothetical protein